MSNEQIIKAVGTAAVYGGLFLIAYAGGVAVALGVLAVVVGNNMERDLR